MVKVKKRKIKVTEIVIASNKIVAKGIMEIEIDGKIQKSEFYWNFDIDEEIANETLKIKQWLEKQLRLVFGEDSVELI